VTPVPGKLFLVADPKQSIYRFRRADVALYHRVKNHLVRAGARRVHLTVSFRSVPAIQELVNSAMSEAMKATAENHQADYVPLHAYRAKTEGQPAIVALPIPRPYGDWDKVVFYAIQRSEPPTVASFVRWLLEESPSLGWRVSSRGSESRPVTPSDVCLLFRRFQSYGRSVTQPYVDALSALDIPHVLVGGRGFHQREEIEAMRVALAAIERPDDELSVFSTLGAALQPGRREPVPFPIAARRPSSVSRDAGSSRGRRRLDPRSPRRPRVAPPGSQPPARSAHHPKAPGPDPRPRGVRSLAGGRSGARELLRRIEELVSAASSIIWTPSPRCRTEASKT
jgi:superfamily I DNA/RNA helicase